MNRLSLNQRARILACLVEGNSVRGTCRLTGAAKGTVLKLLADVGAACAAYQDQALRNLPCKRIECDEIWSFCYCKDKNLSPERKGVLGFGDVWTWTAICADTKLMVCWAVGTREAEVAGEFMKDLAGRLANRVQLTTDGNRAYPWAVSAAFAKVDYAVLMKLYSGNPAAAPYKRPGKKYKEGEYVHAIKLPTMGSPNLDLVSTSYVERANRTMRMGMRRFMRQTDGFSKKIENLAHAVALHFMYYNFGRIHKTLRVTPAMEAGITDHVWSLEEIAALTDQLAKAA